APDSFASWIVPAMTIVLPPQLVPAPAPAPVDDSLASPPAAVGSLPAPAAAAPAAATPSAPSDDSSSGGDDATTAGGGGAAATPPTINHVFLIVLADTDLVALADDIKDAPYFANTLVPKGALLTKYDAISQGAVANGVALISGQAPTKQTLAD